MTFDARLWLVIATVPFPFELDGSVGVGEKIKQISRLQPGIFESLGIRIAMRPGEPWPEQLQNLQVEPAEFAAVVDSRSTEEALSLVQPSLELVLESLSFQMQHALRVIGLNIFDASGELTVGELRESMSYPMPGGLPFNTFRPTAQRVQGVVTALVPDPSRTLPQEDHRLQRALDWYIKGLAAPLQVDQFIFWWIAAELLRSVSGVERSENYTPSCGHELAQCPQCEAPVTKMVLGASMRAFLEDVGGLTHETARRLWRARQIVHGNVAFDSREFDEIPALTHQLQSAVMRALKQHLAIPADSPPFVAGDGLSILPQFGLGGRIAVAEHHVETVALLTIDNANAR